MVQEESILVTVVTHYPCRNDMKSLEKKNYLLMLDCFSIKRSDSLVLIAFNIISVFSF